MPRASRRRPQSSDLTDLQWSAIAEAIPDAAPGGRPRKASRREIVEAILDSRRRVRDYERLAAVAEALITIAAIATLVRRMA